MTEQRDNSGTLSKNADKSRPNANTKRPDYKGTARMDCKDCWLSGWVKGGTRRKFLSLAMKPKPATPTEAPSAEATNDDNRPL